MVDTETVRTIVGIIGNVISFGLFLSPLPTFVKICRSKSVQAFKPDPYVATVLNCAMWVFYGLPFVHPDNFLVATINGVGLVIELIYVIIFLIYSKWTIRRKIIIALFIEIVFMVIVIIITMTFLHTTKARSMLVGMLCLVFNIIMYISPLTVMRLVIRSKSVKYMPFTLSLASFINGGIWLIYALLKFDVFVAVPNALGTLSGAVQLILYATFYKTTPWDDDDGLSDQTPEVQMASKNNP